MNGPTTKEIETTEKVLRLACRLLSASEDAVQLKVDRRPTCTYWVLRASASASTKIVGRGREHAAALKHLVSRFTGGPHLLVILDPYDSEKGENRPVLPNPNYDPVPVLDLTEMILDALGLKLFRVDARQIESGADRRPFYEIDAYVENEDAYRLLTVPQDSGDLTHVAALGRILRACASIAGGKVKVQVKRP